MERWIAGVLFVAIVIFQGWTALGLHPQPLFGPKQIDYYNLQLHAFIGGHTYLHVTPDPLLLRSPNPYNPAERLPGTHIVHDASYYRGHYYIYFGVTPVVTLLLPWWLATGHDLPSEYAVWFFTATGFLASSAFWLYLRRRFFPASGLLALIAGIAVLGLASMTHAVLRRTGVWEEAIAGAYCFAMLSLWCFGRTFESRRPLTWLAAAGLCFGLTVGARPNYVVAAPFLLAPLIWSAWRQRRSQTDPRAVRRSLWRQLGAFGVPMGAIFAGLLGYNYIRFGNPLEFGAYLQVNAAYESAGRHFTPTYVTFNTYVYYFSPAQWSRYFPFIEVIHAPPEPVDYYGIEYAYGLLVNFPFAWLALAAPLAWRRRPPGQRVRLQATVAALAFFYASVGALLLTRWGAAARYMVDFTPALMLLAGIGLLSLERLARGGARVAVRTLGAAAAAVSVFVGVMLSFQLHELLRQNRPEVFRQVAHAFDTPVFWVERLLRVHYGPREMELRFPRDRTGRIEPLVTTGWEFYSDYLFVEYLDGQHLRIGFDHLNHGRLWSRPLAIDYGATHTLQMALGSFFPPPAHPFFDRKSPEAVDGMAHRLRVVFDGQTIFDVPSGFYDASPEGWHFGEDRAAIYGRRFTGQILGIHPIPYTVPAPLNAGTGAVEMDLAFPPDDAIGHPLPLLATGAPGHGDLLRVVKTRRGWVRFGYDHWDSGLVESAEVPITESVTHVLRLSLPSLLPAARTPQEAVLRDNLRVEIDGVPVWARRVPFFPVDPKEVYFGQNGIGASSSELQFSGAINRIGRVAAPEINPRPLRGPLLLRLSLPKGVPGRCEPLVSLGVTGRADVLSIAYLDSGHVQFRIDHWGAGLWQSAPVALDYAGFHDLEIRMPTLNWPAPSDLGEFVGEIALRLDGTQAWRETVTFYRAAPETLVVGANQPGASTCDPVFTGGIASIRRPDADGLAAP